MNHRILLDKLEHYRLRGCALHLLQSYLNNRYQNIFYTNKIFSDHLPITIGVPQSSVLGPFLFFVYINDLPNTCNAKMMLFANDSVMVCDDSDIQRLKSKTEKEFYIIEEWTKINKVSLNYNKTKCMLFSRGKSSVKNFASNTTNGPLTNDNVIKYLGVIFDHRVSWEQHTQHVVAKLCMAKGLLTKLRHYVQVTVLRNVYFDIVHSYLQYGVTSWSNAASKCTKKIQAHQNYIIKIITKTSSFKTKLLPIYSDLKLLKLNNIFNLEVLKIVFKFQVSLF